MQNVVRRVKFSTKGRQLCYPPNRFSVRTYATVNGSRKTKQHTALLFVGTAVFSATAGYLANRDSEKFGSSVTDLENTRYGTPEDFRKAIEELKAAFPGPGAVSDDPVVVAPYGFSQNDYHPSWSARSWYISCVLTHLSTVSNHTVVVHPETTEDVAKIVKIAVKCKMPVTPYSGGTSLEGNFRAVRLAVFFSQVISIAQSRSFSIPSTRSAVYALICPGWTRFLRFTVGDNWGFTLFGLTIPPRGGLRSRLSGRGSVDGCKRDSERKRCVWDTLILFLAKAGYPGIPLFFPVSVG